MFAGRLALKSFPKTLRVSSFSTVLARPEPQLAENFTQIGTRHIFDHDHDQYRELCRKFYAEHVTPFHNSWEEKGEVPRELWRKAGDNGLLCVTMPEEYGGMGVDIRYAAVNWEEQSYANASGPGWALHSEIVAPYLLHYGSEQQKRQYLPGMAKGTIITAIAMTEPGAGSDLQGMRTTAVKDGEDHFIVNGSKTYITNGWLSDMVIVCAKTDVNGKGSKGISLFLVDTNTPGFKKGKKLSKIGMKVAACVCMYIIYIYIYKYMCVCFVAGFLCFPLSSPSLFSLIPRLSSVGLMVCMCLNVCVYMYVYCCFRHKTHPSCSSKICAFPAAACWAKKVEASRT